MTHIKESLHVRCPRDLSREHLCEMLLTGSEENSPHSLLLTVKLPWTGIELAKEVSVEYTVPAETANADEPIGVKWTPAPGGIYPSFDGVLHVLKSNHAYSSILELSGHYTPPLGVLGLGFDAAIGHKVAEATVKYLLEGLSSGIMARYRTDQWQQTFTHFNEQPEAPAHVQVIKATCVVVRAALPPPPISEQPT